MLAFILTTCSHCQAATGLLTRLQTEYGPRGLQVLESAIDQGGQALVGRHNTVVAEVPYGAEREPRGDGRGARH